jgi:hypothetical protein
MDSCVIKPAPLLALQPGCLHEADHLAEQYMKHHHDNHLRALMFPETRVLLHGPDGTITHNMKKELILLKQGDKALLHITKTNGWHPNTAYLVNWHLHSQVLTKMSHCTMYFKLIHDLLLVGWLVNKYDLKYSPKCSSCSHLTKTTTHFHQCESPSRTKHRLLLLQMTHKLLDSRNTDPTSNPSS